MTPIATTQLSTIGQIAMTVKDVPRAVEFYRDRRPPSAARPT